ncbi:DUF3551 domain-containing protein [Pseudorhodoplanes sinuspersici]|uniref:Uncharacterized protein n=1 Tax=Pseudorhodoplanes sinuspersici TaxID=1235591 RepID=A0A1W6ZV33_9HYPH|nr:DUF3551 domain-containing protein [Pseudorhodoplanes sinuspersici]ARQ01202.1 hypothetical protein CAK95_20450 [Pseudorhodoplanes sinuspersici]RKE72864.1 uncharacterized protein DUF3551 [Pseudorhodoplanes sinuspersici]
MRIAMSFAFLIAIGSAAIAQTQPQPQPKVSAEERFCLTEKTSGAVSCGFATMAECLAASNAGRDGQCELNPRLTTGSGTRR